MCFANYVLWGFTSSPSSLRPFPPPVFPRPSYASRPFPELTSRIHAFFFYFVAFFPRRRLIARHSRSRRGARSRLINGFVTPSLRRGLFSSPYYGTYRFLPRRNLSDVRPKTEFYRKAVKNARPVRAVAVSIPREVRHEMVSGRFFFYTSPLRLERN